MKLKHLKGHWPWYVLAVPGLPYLVFMGILPGLYGDWTYVQSVWERWQTLNAGMIALMAALITVVYARHQAEEHRLAKLKAARAVLPAALSQFIDYARESMIFSRRIHEFHEKKDSQEQLDIGSISLPSFAPEIVPILKECIEFANSDEEVAAFSRILRWWQVHAARQGGLFSRTVHPVEGFVALDLNALTGIIDSAILHALIEGVFPQLKNGAVVLPTALLRGDVEKALFLAGVFDYPGVVPLIDAHVKSFMERFW